MIFRHSDSGTSGGGAEADPKGAEIGPARSLEARRGVIVVGGGHTAVDVVARVARVMAARLVDKNHPPGPLPAWCSGAGTSSRGKMNALSPGLSIPTFFSSGVFTFDVAQLS